MTRAQCPPISISHLLSEAQCEAHVDGADCVITGLSQDSRSVQAGDLFVCVRGESFNGHQFVSEALAAGAVALLVDEEVDVSTFGDVTVVRVNNVREVLGTVASAAFGHPSRQLLMIGVTGTTGKTSTTSMLGAILNSSGRTARVFGTLTNVRTTPEAIEVQALLHECRSNGVEAVVMEVSSHALVLHRVDGIVYDIAVFTNIGRDHLDFHGTEEAYFAAKAMLFSPDRARRAVVNGDDVKGRLLFDAAAIPTTLFQRSDVQVREMALDHIDFEWHQQQLHVPMGGEFTLMNALAAITVAHELGLSSSQIQDGLLKLPPVTGRFQSVPNSRGIGIVVDYAHTPESVTSLLASIRPLCRGRLVVVFGCGGNRDAGKRPLMGAIASELADEVVVTSDNPRMEDPDRIIEDICAGIPASYSHLRRVPDRAEAITSAISRARRDDIVVIAGKGHESSQEIQGEFFPFSDVEVATRAAELGEEVQP